MERSLRILHLEDEPDFCELVKALLAKDGLAADTVLVRDLEEFVAALLKGEQTSFRRITDCRAAQESRFCGRRTSGVWAHPSCSFPGRSASRLSSPARMAFRLCIQRTLPAPGIASPSHQRSVLPPLETPRHAQVHNCRSSERYWIASEMWSLAMALRAGQVGNRAGDFQNAVVGAGAEVQGPPSRTSAAPWWPRRARSTLSVRGCPCGRCR